MSQDPQDTRPDPSATAKPARPPQENPLRNIVIDVVIPTLILMKLSRPERLGPVVALVLALAFPVGHAIHGFVKNRKVGFIPALGFVSVLLTGGLSLLKLDPKWVAVKEAAVPGIIGLAIIGSLRTRFPLVRSILFNDTIMDIGKVDAELTRRGNRAAFERLLAQTSVLLSSSFFLSAALNFTLARIFLVSAPGSAAFNEELGKMHLWSWPIIVVPSMLVMMVSLWFLVRGLRQLTGYTMEEILRIDADGRRST